MQMEVREDDGIRVVYLEGELDAATIREFQQRMEELIREGVTRVIFNGRGLAFANTATFGFFYYLHETLGQQGGYFLLCELTPKISRILNMLGLTKKLAIYSTEQEALLAARVGGR